MKVDDIITNKKFVLHINGRAVGAYDNLRDARGDVYELQKTMPNLKFEIRQEVCRDEPLPSGTMRQSGLAEAGSPAQQAAIAINMKKAGKKPKSKNQLNEFDPGGGSFGKPPRRGRRPPPSGGDDGEQNDGTGSWFNDSDIKAIVGPNWTDELDLSFGHGDFESDNKYSRRIKAAIIDEAQNWLHENGYQARIIDVRNNKQRENLDWLIQGDLVKLQEGITEGKKKVKSSLKENPIAIAQGIVHRVAQATAGGAAGNAFMSVADRLGSGKSGESNISNIVAPESLEQGVAKGIRLAQQQRQQASYRRAQTQLAEAVVDIPQQQLSDIFTPEGKLQPEVRTTVLDAVKTIQNKFPENKILDFYMVGAPVTFQYAPTSDMDVSLVYDPKTDPGRIQEIWQFTRQLEKTIPPYKNRRPYQLTPETRAGRQDLTNADAAYDVIADQWIKKPSREKVDTDYNSLIGDPNSAIQKTYAAAETTVKSALLRLYQELNANGLSDKAKNTLTNINQYVVKIIKKWRGAGYQKPVGDRISANWSTGNIIYKMFDREGYNEVFDLIKSIVKNNFVVDDLFVQNLKTKIQPLINDEIGYRVSENTDPNKLPVVRKKGVAEGFPYDVDHMPGKTNKHTSTNCTTCHGRKSMYKLGGKLYADNKQGAVKVECPTCGGTGDEQGVSKQQLDEKCWDTHRQVGMKKKGNRMVPNCVPKESIEEATICSECGGPSYSNPMLAEKKDACYHKVKSRVKVWPSAYASGQLVQCRRRGAKNWGTGGKKK